MLFLLFLSPFRVEIKEDTIFTTFKRIIPGVSFPDTGVYRIRGRRERKEYIECIRNSTLYMRHVHFKEVKEGDIVTSSGRIILPAEKIRKKAKKIYEKYRERIKPASKIPLPENPHWRISLVGNKIIASCRTYTPQVELVIQIMMDFSLSPLMIGYKETLKWKAK
ncbi:hypothetical protein DRQ16_00125 [bacterium]|nr:MAG: hypothetical protein DRQ16_00125 [bacterium]